ncbi:ABC transporter permease [Couchioplanes caeruleus]|uniref:Transport permease protein n=2 Tax=Couchioplanes caeruleus TaxID=56438 RepID=A0A1K0GQE2_9ACTN|nr:ABC transporter permease [Couchioplanes caeruleus]OJF11483.1 ABC transporter [Couchioplanes caeruleus subsp. caeruleus]ROP32342.1 ABC-2 type transport system permease protein [Couchioplanes caeruleus]
MRLGLHQGMLEIRQFLRSREQVVFTLAFPVIMIIVFGSIFKADIGDGVNLTQYFVTGMIATGLMTAGFQALAIQIPMERDRGVLKRLLGTPMPRWVYFAGKVLMVGFIAVLETIILLIVATLFFGVELPNTAGKWLTFLWVCVLGITACTLCGIAFSSLARTGRSAPAVVTPVALILQFTSGVFFVFTDLPAWMQNVASVFPLKWMCQGLRSVFLPASFGTQEPGGSYNLPTVALVLGAWCLVALVLCLTTFRWTTKRDG